MKGAGAPDPHRPWGRPWSPEPHLPEKLGRRARKAAAGAVRVVLGLPLLGAHMVVCGAVTLVADAADAIEGKP